MDKTTTLQTRLQAANTASSLRQEMGGQSALDALVGAFYFNVLNDQRLAHFFATSNTDAIRNHQRRFLAAVLGGPDLYHGRTLLQAHRSLVQEHGLDHSHFDAMADLLASTVHQFGHPKELNQKIVARVNALRADVLGTSL